MNESFFRALAIPWKMYTKVETFEKKNSCERKTGWTIHAGHHLAVKL